MNLTIVTDDNLVIIDGVGRRCDLSDAGLADVHAVHWNGQSGHLEMNDGNEVPIENIDAFQAAIDAHAAAAPPPPPEPTPEQLRERKRQDINRAYEEAMLVVRGAYPASEIAGWPEQVRAVEQFDENPSADIPLLDHLAAARGISRSQMADRIRSKRDAYLQIYGTLTGARQALEADLDAIDLEAADAADQIAAIDESTLADLIPQ